MTRHPHSERGAQPGGGARAPRTAVAAHALRALGPAALAVCVLALVLAFIFAVASAFAQPTAAEPNRRVHRGITAMERAIDEMLVDSPNFLVSGRDNTRGVYIDAYGALFTFDATLINKDWDFDFDQDWSGFDFEVKEEGDKIVIYRGKGKNKEKIGETPAPEIVEFRGRDGDAEAPEAPEPPETPEARARAEHDREKADRLREEVARARRNARKQGANREEKLYERGKQEMIDFLLDYGDAIEALRDNQSIEIVAYFRDHEYFEARDFSHFSVRAKVGDLRAYANGTLTEAAMIAKIEKTEY